jgi:poly-gamma-glutamate synthesis protein (capsule biosynthesis protein)
MAVVLVGADICPIEGNQEYFVKGDAESLFHDLMPEFAAANLVVANLECPFIEKSTPILKTGPTFGVPGSCINGIKAAGIDVLCLANNHIMDHGEAGLRHTMEICESAGVATVGAGPGLEAAGRVLIRELDGVRVAILAVAEREFSIASRSSWGANPIDVIEFVRTVSRHRTEFDRLIVLYHGAAEFHAPTPKVQNTCRFMIEQGASAVIVQHPHVLGGNEKYQNGHIVYGQGALVMDEAIYRNKSSFHEGFLAKLTLERSAPAGMEIIPFRQSSPVPGARRLKGDEENRLRETLALRSAAIADSAFVEAEWLRFCDEIRHGALSSLLGHGGIRRRLNAQGWLEARLRKSRRFPGLRNMVLCETHREKLETIFTESQKGSR